MTDAVDFDEAVIELAREHFYLGDGGPGRTLQAAAALHALHFLHFFSLLPNTLCLMRSNRKPPATTLTLTLLYTYCGLTA